jgi:hypothetical protein
MKKSHNLMKKLLLLPFLIAIAAISFSFTDPPSGNTSSKVVSKSFVFPVAGTRNYIRDKWGASRAGGLRKHKGIDIHARKGTPVVAICDGVIVTRDHTLIGGKTLWLKSPRHSWVAYYAHLDKQMVKEGQKVRKGQVIGTVGNHTSTFALWCFAGKTLGKSITFCEICPEDCCNKESAEEKTRLYKKVIGYFTYL